jgi:hypothetical protein
MMLHHFVMVMDLLMAIVLYRLPVLPDLMTFLPDLVTRIIEIYFIHSNGILSLADTGK